MATARHLLHLQDTRCLTLTPIIIFTELPTVLHILRHLDLFLAIRSAPLSHHSPHQIIISLHQLAPARSRQKQRSTHHSAPHSMGLDLIPSIRTTSRHLFLPLSVLLFQVLSRIEAGHRQQIAPRSIEILPYLRGAWLQILRPQSMQRLRRPIREAASASRGRSTGQHRSSWINAVLLLHPTTPASPGENRTLFPLHITRGVTDRNIMWEVLQLAIPAIREDSQSPRGVLPLRLSRRYNIGYPSGFVFTRKNRDLGKRICVCLAGPLTVLSSSSFHWCMHTVAAIQKP